MTYHFDEYYDQCDSSPAGEKRGSSGRPRTIVVTGTDGLPKEVTIKTAKMAHFLRDHPGFPQSNWLWHEIIDEGKYKSSFTGKHDLPGGLQCTICETWHRLSHVISHPEWPGKLRVGQICATLLAAVDAKGLEKEFIEKRNKEARAKVREAKKAGREAAKAESRRLKAEAEQKALDEHIARVQAFWEEQRAKAAAKAEADRKAAEEQRKREEELAAKIRLIEEENNRRRQAEYEERCRQLEIEREKQRLIDEEAECQHQIKVKKEQERRAAELEEERKKKEAEVARLREIAGIDSDRRKEVDRQLFESRKAAWEKRLQELETELKKQVALKNVSNSNARKILESLEGEERETYCVMRTRQHAEEKTALESLRDELRLHRRIGENSFGVQFNFAT